MLESIFNEVYYKFTEGDYNICSSTNRKSIINKTPPKMESVDALQATVNYLIWEWSHDHEDQRFKKLIKEIAIPPKDYDLSGYSFTELLDVVSPELIKTSDIVKKPQKRLKVKKPKKPLKEKSVFETGSQEIEPKVVNGHIDILSLF